MPQSLRQDPGNRPTGTSLQDCSARLWLDKKKKKNVSRSQTTQLLLQPEKRHDILFIHIVTVLPGSHNRRLSSSAINTRTVCLVGVVKANVSAARDFRTVASGDAANAPTGARRQR